MKFDWINRIGMGMQKLSLARSKHILFHPRTVIDANSFFEGNNVFYENTLIINSSIGYGTYVGADSKLIGIKIGRYCSIAPSFRVLGGSHPVHEFVSTHPCFYSLQKPAGFTFSKRQRFEETRYAAKKRYFAVVGNDVWIGTDAAVMQGVTVGDGAVIGAKALVTKDVEPYSINVGIPAKLVGYRFMPDQIDFLLKFKWWNKEVEWLKDHWEIFNDITRFFNEFHKESGQEAGSGKRGEQEDQGSGE